MARRDRKSFLKEVINDETISDLTKAEILFNLGDRRFQDFIGQERRGMLGTDDPTKNIFESDLFNKKIFQSGVELFTPRSQQGGTVSQSAVSFLESARLGTDKKFKARQNAQALFDVSTDQPGRRQTLLSSSNRNNALLR